MVSVKLVNYIQNTSEMNIKLKGDYLTLSPTLKLKEGVKYKLIVKQGELYIKDSSGRKKIPGSFTLIPESYDQNLIYINDRPYQGAMDFTIENEKYIRPINQLHLEDYLKGVVPFEVFSEWDLEALKAQSLAARTYALMHLNGEQQMDDTIKFQVYGGFSTFERTNQAVEETKGEIITHNGKPIHAFYSASNGGHTESNGNAWGGSDISYYPIKPDPYDPKEPWEITLHKQQLPTEYFLFAWEFPGIWKHFEEKNKEITANIKSWLQSQGYQNTKILSIPHFSISNQQTESGRSINGSITIRFMYQLPGNFVLMDQISLDDVPLTKIRPMIGGSIFRSYLITSFDSSGSAYQMKGNGYGHGVGMSQWGAQQMARAGKSYKQIIQFYFPGTKISSVN
ncbi:SpoIID/LytB domain-containing protein [Salinibacillus xinjiangensis]|uniref:SpoIID/LytB domain-containing protein n=2 Tax=Salinibacillus xinjiangensis TaxID=1229268 RepID=A0A6G1X3T5_9BACI|nr:SpoIID/LytB domain-containing protein [Salinibacillus xinjiangensis]